MADRQATGKSDTDIGANKPNKSSARSKTKRKYNRKKHRPKSSGTSSVESNKTQQGHIHEKTKDLYRNCATAEHDTVLEHTYSNGNTDYDQLGARPKNTNVFEQPPYDIESNSTGWNMIYANSNVVYSYKSRMAEETNKNDVHSSEEDDEVSACEQLSEYSTNNNFQLLVQDANNEEETNIEMYIKSKEEKKLKTEINSNQIQTEINSDNETDLFIAMHETFSSLSDIKEYLLQRMGNPIFIDYDVIGFTETMTSTKQGCTLGCVAQIRFYRSDKSLAASQLLNLSNTNTTSNVSCYYELDDSDEEQSASDADKESEPEVVDVRTEIFDQVSRMHDIHNQKIRLTAEKIEDIQMRLDGYQGLFHDDFENLSTEKDACVDKLKELDGQKSEFYNHVERMRDTLSIIGTQNESDNELDEVRKNFGIECQRLMSALPIYARRADILSTITGNQVCVISGETGSGKSTQIAQYIYEAGFAANGMIVCTQPSKFDAVSLATKVSSELASSVGQIVGYEAGMQSNTTSATKVIYMTDHILLNECLYDRDLMRYSCIIIDKADERSIYTDLLLGILKQCLARRPEIRVVITSATIDAHQFVDYFEGLCPVLKVSGRICPVDKVWKEDDYFDSPFPDDYEEKAVRKAVELHTTMPLDAGDILVFLTDASETENAVRKFCKQVGEKDAYCIQIHDSLAPEEQLYALEPTPTGIRKVVFATPKADTSLPIPGINFVVDTGVVKEMVFDPTKNINSLNLVRVSQRAANQRKDRAGRTNPGHCNRLYTENEFNEMKNISKPEVLRVRISQSLLKLMEFGIDPTEFKYVQAPSDESMKQALDELTQLGAVVDNVLTDLGKWISKVPLEPRLGVFIKKGIDKNVLPEVLVVASFISQQGLVFQVGTQEEKKTAERKKDQFCHFGGDLLTMLNVYREWYQTNEKEKENWCVENGINGKSVVAVRDIMNEIIFVLRKEYNMETKHGFGNPETVDPVVQTLIFECMTSNLSYFLGHEQAGYMIIDRMQRFKLHPSSSLHALGLKPTWVVFSQVQQSSGDFLMDATPVPEAYVREALTTGSLNIDLNIIERLNVQPSLTVSVGRHVFRKFVGSMHENRCKVEDDISKSCDNSTVVIEANEQTGEITLYSIPEYEHISAPSLKAILDDITARLYTENEFNDMKNISKPEVLRVRISQSLLKLMKFGIDPTEFKSVQAPSDESMKQALDEFTQLGAVVDNVLTDLGKWISKVPLEPRLGVFIKKGIDKNVLPEVLVVASFISQQGLVFQVGTQEEKKTAERKKDKFCHFGGDLLTMLNVYREWDQTNEKEKENWCVKNGINGKSVAAVRDIMNEIIFVLGKEYNMETKHRFGNPETVDPVVQTLIFECMTSNLSYFLGHEQAGYMIIDRMQRFKLHPSSSLHALGLKPTWVVFSQVQPSSGDFLMDATPVPEAYVREALTTGSLNIDLNIIERLKVQPSLTVSVGRHVFRKFVGRMQEVEDDISKSCDNSTVVIEANEQTGEITLYSIPDYEHISAALLKAILKAIDDITARLLLESREEMIGNNGSGIRAVIGRGGCICDMLMPSEFRSFLILQKDDLVKINEDEIRDMLGFYGSIEHIRVATGINQQPLYWGRATFTHSVDAEAAVGYINDDEESDIYTVPVTCESQTSFQKKKECTMKLTWLRRKAKGHCYVKLSRPKDQAFLVSKSFKLDGSKVTISLAQNNKDLYLKGIGQEAMEDDVKACLTKVLGHPEDQCTDRFRVVIPRHNVALSENQKDDLEEKLSILITDLTQTPEDKFRVIIRDFKENTVNYVAYVMFDDQNILQETGGRLIDNNAQINGSHIHVNLESKLTVHVDKKLYQVVAQDLDELIECLNSSSSCIEKKSAQSGVVVLNINASTANQLARVKVSIDRTINGDILECNDIENCHVLFCSSGRQRAMRIEHETNTLIYVDERNMNVTVKGSCKGKMKALTMIRDLISSYDNSDKIFRLEIDNLPAGFMKSLFIKYGADLKGILDDTGLTGVQLKLRLREIEITGADESIDEALRAIDSLRKEMMTESIVGSGVPDCPICLGPVKEHDVYHLEYCGHAYCNVCFISMIQCSIMHVEFPVKCAWKGCDQPLVVRDFDAMIKLGKLKSDVLTDASLTCFITSNKDRYRFCITPCCAMVYRVSLKPDGELFVCPACSVHICTSCHIAYHGGISCTMYRSVREDMFDAVNNATDT